MEAMSMDDGHAVLDANRCIGCGLCVTTCQSGALTLDRKAEEAQSQIPKNQMEAYLLRAKARATAKAELTDKLERHKRV